ncbi:MAG TPA: hypothetical protein VG963_02925, partial [Polyangiaceae bacterium]|nr:hypothetical protein [Polyangiaceae bacterium]
MLGVREQGACMDLLDAIYDVEQPRSSWLRGVLRAFAPFWDRGSGLGLVQYDVSRESPRIWGMDGVNISASNIALGADTYAQARFAKAIQDCHRHQVCSTMREHMPDPEIYRAVRQRYERVGVVDQLLLNANVSDQGCALYVFSDRKLCLGVAERRLATKLAQHWATAYRLQTRLEQTLLERAYERVGPLHQQPVRGRKPERAGTLSAREREVVTLARLG